ncbi:MAG TPA: restriction endonuclease [Humisphaera sp.]|jgi:restriction system protein|nr:restriction endonuclease [Humisphaera sp.]
MLEMDAGYRYLVYPSWESQEFARAAAQFPPAWKVLDISTCQIDGAAGGGILVIPIDSSQGGESERGASVVPQSASAFRAPIQEIMKHVAFFDSRANREVGSVGVAIVEHSDTAADCVYWAIAVVAGRDESLLSRVLPLARSFGLKATLTPRLASSVWIDGVTKNQQWYRIEGGGDRVGLHYACLLYIASHLKAVGNNSCLARACLVARIRDTETKPSPPPKAQVFASVFAQMAEIDAMSGAQFETFVAALLQQRGYVTKMVGGANDKGVDLIAEKDGVRYAVQCKRYASKLSRSAVSDCVAGMRLYDCGRSMVVTNSGFHHGAVQLAAANDCILAGRPTLLTWLTSGGNGVERYADFSGSMILSDVEVRVLSVEVGPIAADPAKASGADVAAGPHLLIRVQLRNLSTTKKHNFRTWGLHPVVGFNYDSSTKKLWRSFGEDVAELSDNFANEYRLRDLGVDRPPDQVDHQVLYPGKTIYDALVFEPPVSRMEYLQLRLPCWNLIAGNKGALRLMIPAAALATDAQAADK